MNNIVDIKFFKDRNKVRNYLHFDRKINDQKIFEYVTNPDKVSQHSFFPTISYFLNEKKIARKIQKKTLRKKKSVKICLIITKELDLKERNLSTIRLRQSTLIEERCTLS